MTATLNAHIEGGVIVVDDQLPARIPDGPILVTVEIPSPADLTTLELAQSQSGFVKHVLLDPEEDVWDND